MALSQEEFNKLKLKIQESGQPFALPKGKETLKNIVNDPFETLVAKPATRFGQLLARPIVSAFGDEATKQRYDQAVQEDVSLPSFAGNIDIEGQKIGTEGAKQIFGDAAKSASYLYGGTGLANTAANAVKGQVLKSAVTGATTGAISGGAYGFGDSIQEEGSTVGTILEDTVKGALLGGATGGVFGGGAGLAVKSARGVMSLKDRLLGKIGSSEGSIIERISSPDVSQATKVSLNPVEALKRGGEDINISVGGKLKKLSELNINDKAKLKVSTTKSIDKFTQEAEKFKNTRNPLNDPTEIVGQRTDAAVGFADKKRQLVGKKMGEIEQKYANTVTPIKDNTYKSFVDIVDYAKDPQYGVKGQNAEIVTKLVEDFDKLSENGLTVAERNKFVRSWQTYIADAKDAFGNFKENATVNTKIQNAVNNLKNETVDAVSSMDKTYRGLRKDYSEYMKLQEFADALLGKDGLLGDRIKGGATIKRALKSNSDAGARQFLIKLKELTGYDALKDGDLALTAMENVGDFQGLSLLEVLREGKTGLANRILEKGQELLVGDNATRVKKYINKTTK